MDLGLKGKRAIVAGGTRGIGRAIANLLAAEGCDVGLCARDAAQVEAAVADLKKMGVNATGGTVDVTDSAAQKAWIESAAEALGGLDIFVANVSALSQELDEAAWRQSFEVDMMATFNGAEAALPIIDKSDGGAMVFIASISALEIARGARPYGAMKAAVLYYTKGLARTLAPQGIRVNAVSPGNIYFEDGVWGRMEREKPDFFAGMLAANPMGRMGRPEEVANAAVFLASPAAGFITGTNLIVDGALTHGVQY
jgi:NAD(P)-dependent dehydrogenase (short-subunit alcohol dehydrogenase family)